MSTQTRPLMTTGHPSWCNPARCTVLPDLPLDDGVHLSRTVAITTAITIVGPLVATVWLHRGGADATTYLVITIPDTGGHAMFALGDAAAALTTVTGLLDLADEPTGGDAITYTDPDVLGAGVRDGWADPETDPTRIDWAPRQAAAAIGFDVVDGRPVNPCERTRVRHGRHELGHWGEALAADALITATHRGHRWLLMVERGDGYGWAAPGGMAEPAEDLTAAAVRELAEETGLQLPAAVFMALPARYVPDPRASDEAWIVTVPSRTDLGHLDELPAVAGGDDATRAAWVRADSYSTLVDDLTDRYGGAVFAAHRGLLAEACGAGR